MYSYKTKGTCSREIQFDVENNIVKEIRFIGGCNDTSDNNSWNDVV